MGKSPSKPRLYGTLKHATTELVSWAGGSDAAAAQTRVRKSQIARAADPDIPEVHLPADAIEDLEAFVNAPIVSRYLLEQLDWTLLPPVDLSNPDALTVEVASTGEKASSLFARFVAAMSDRASPGVVDKDEARDLLLCFDELIEVGCRARALLRARLGSEQPPPGRQ